MSQKTCLVYFNCYTKGYNDIIKFAENIRKYDQVFVLGILENDLDTGNSVYTPPIVKYTKTTLENIYFDQTQKDLNPYF